MLGLAGNANIWEQCSGRWRIELRYEGGSGAGTMRAVEAYRVFVVAVASCVTRLDPFPAAFDRFEKRLVREPFPWPSHESI
eukprot:3219795-Pyramimonas_sp.AAC.1